MVPSIYSLIGAGELVTVRVGAKTSNPHLDATGQHGQLFLPALMTPGSLSVITKDLITDVVLLDEVTEQLLISTVRYATCSGGSESNFDSQSLLGIQDSAGRLTAVSQKVQQRSMAFCRTGSASSRLRLEPMAELRPMAPNPGTGTSVLPNGSDPAMVVRKH